MSNRKEVEVAHKRVPLKKLFHGKELREAMAELEKFRQQFNEQEFFYGAKVYLDVSYGEVMAHVRRPETDNEYNKRIELERIEQEAKAERRRIREIKAKERAERRRIEEQEQAEVLRQREIEHVKSMARKLNMTVADFLR